MLIDGDVYFIAVPSELIRCHKCTQRVVFGTGDHQQDPRRMDPTWIRVCCLSLLSHRGTRRLVGDKSTYSFLQARGADGDFNEAQGVIGPTLAQNGRRFRDDVINDFRRRHTVPAHLLDDLVVRLVAVGQKGITQHSKPFLQRIWPRQRKIIPVGHPVDCQLGKVAYVMVGQNGLIEREEFAVVGHCGVNAFAFGARGSAQ